MLPAARAELELKLELEERERKRDWDLGVVTQQPRLRDAASPWGLLRCSRFVMKLREQRARARVRVSSVVVAALPLVVVVESGRRS